jgi:hypothetical protein
VPTIKSIRDSKRPFEPILSLPRLRPRVPFPVPSGEPEVWVRKSCWVLAGWRACHYLSL